MVIETFVFVYDHSCRAIKQSTTCVLTRTPGRLTNSRIDYHGRFSKSVYMDYHERLSNPVYIALGALDNLSRLRPFRRRRLE